tara:strand:+ start:793 stop:945 length:153 start_codon:yes stop_codon:yes gene_type:complete
MDWETPRFNDEDIWSTDDLLELVMDFHPMDVPVDLYYALAERGIEVSALY